MLDGMTRLLPMASVGFVGMVRDEESLVASTYANRLPARLDGREVFVLDPMLATGGTLVTVVSMLLDRGAAAVTAVCLLAAPEGMARVEAPSPATTCGWSRARSTTSSTTRATSCPASATPATACSARSKQTVIPGAMVVTSIRS